MHPKYTVCGTPSVYHRPHKKKGSMNTTDLQEHAHRLRQQGCTILPPQLTAAACDEAQQQLDRLAGERDRGGFELIFNKASVFEGMLHTADVLALVRHMLGADALLSAMHGSRLAPQEGGSGLHADGAITGHNRAASMAAADAGCRITSHTMALNTIWCISEFSSDNGATWLVPGSHLHEGLDIPADAVQRARPMEAARGSVIVFDVNTWHGPSRNNSEAFRYAVLNPWRRRWQRCEYEMARVADPGVLQRAGDNAIIFGLDAVAPTVERWRWDASRGQPLPDDQEEV